MSDLKDKLYEGPKGVAAFTPGAVIPYKQIDPADLQSECGLDCLVQVVDLDRIEGDMIVFSGLSWFNTPAEQLVRIIHSHETGEAEISEYLQQRFIQ